jgi:cytochrome c biogenesis protein
MKIIKFQTLLKLLTDLTFAIILLGIIALVSAMGSVIEQDEPISFYEENYIKPIYGFIDSNFILTFGLNHIYVTWWFLLLLVLLSISLVGCTIKRQFPLVNNSKEYFFKKEKNSFKNLQFSIELKNNYYLKENLLGSIQELNFYLYQKGNSIYGYKGLIGRLSPIIVHFSLLLILFGSSCAAFQNFKAQEILPKGELFHIQNPLKVGKLTTIPQLNIRVNDFWVEYEKNQIHQFYSNLSILNNFGKEIKEQTISVNNPLRYKNVDFYQSDWNLIGIRIKTVKDNKIIELPLFPLKTQSKLWVTWIKEENRIKTLLIDQFQNVILLYDEKGNFIENLNIGDNFQNNFIILDILSSTGLLIKYDPTITIIYLGFGLLMITTLLSYLPYTQLWIHNKENNCWIGSVTNRGKLQLEIEFENLIRGIEYQQKQKNSKKMV